jgi:uncharacterized protein with ParB-like and HNH nuclease domain
VRFRSSDDPLNQYKSKMKTESHSINDVLAKNATSFFIPPFQRAYAWGRPEIERFFNDILRIIKSELDLEQHDKLEHFFGTLVIKEEKSGFANKSVVVDGQQRLTTTLLFLIALRDLETDEKKKEFITNSYLTNISSSFQDKIKLKQVTKDWESYRALVTKKQPDPGIIFNAYKLFLKLIDDVKRTNPEIQLEHYLIAIQRINVAVIFLDERPFKGEDPQIIFETLNSLGKPLTLSDLVRNFVLLNMESSKQSEIYEKVWHPKIELILNDDSSKYFRDYLQYKTRTSVKVVSDNNTKEIYQLFKDFVEEEFTTHNDFINDIVRYVRWYKWIITEVVTDSIYTDSTKDREIKELLRNIFHDIKAEAFKPFVLGLLEYNQDNSKTVHLSDDGLISILKTIRTYLTRRRILGLTQGENKNIVLLSKHIEDLALGNVSIIDLLTNMIYSLRFPNDYEIKNALLSMNFYEGLKKYSKFILGKIEEHNTKVAVDFRNPMITIEHIMPQKLNDEWKNDLGDNYMDVHKRYLHNIGNLILTEFNSEIGNKSFVTKKEKLSTSSLNYRLDVINREIWNEASIEDHQRNMISWFLNTFPLPDEYKDKDNWYARINESMRFSPLDIDAGNLAEGRKPSEMIIDGFSFKATNWQAVLINFLKYLKDSSDYDFDAILDNQFELFGRDVIVKWHILKQRIEENIDLTNRYKTFEEETWEKAKNLTDSTFFIHINISASTCMSRISNIMNKFNMPENSVEIVLK